MTVEARAATTRVPPAVSAALNLKSGGVCLIAGAVGGWAGAVVGGATLLAAIGLFLVPSLFPGSCSTGCWLRWSPNCGS